MTDWVAWHARLVATLGHLAAEPVGQKAYLISIGVEGSADELALEFDDAYRPLIPHMAELKISGLAIAKLARLNDVLTEMSGADHLELWETAALETSNNWSQIRRLATEIIHDLES
jgi:hypothetical protein